MLFFFANKRQEAESARRERGNALFLILIAVALFAALSYVVTQSGRSGSGGMSRETAQLRAGLIIQYAQDIRTAVLRLQLTNSCTIDEIDFRTGYTGPYAGDSYWWPINPTRRANGTCDVFGPNGAGVPSVTFGQEYFRSAGSNRVFGIRRNAVLGIGTDPSSPNNWSSTADYNTAEILYSGVDVDVNICRAINQSLGITSTLAATPFNPSRPYINDGGNAIGVNLPPGTEFAGHAEGCFCYGGIAGECNPYFTLIER